ncbi:Hexosyltransferase [Sergentomyia squamirostris]
MVFCVRKSFLVISCGFIVCFYYWYISQSKIFCNSQCDLTANNKVENVSDEVAKLSPEDKNRLIDLTNFEYVINQKSCRELNIQPLVLIMVHSAPGNEQKRNLIRKTWGRKDPRAHLLFLLGSVISITDQAKLKEENRKHRDLVQGSFLDTYRNMTYKHAMVLKWFIYSCPEALFLLKTDDDVFVNTPTLYDSLEKGLSPISVSPKRLVACYQVIGANILRDNSKWRVSPEEYHGDYYPPYCMGYVVLFSADAVLHLYREVQDTPYFWIDDVHITGTLTKKTGILITGLNSMVLTKSQVQNILQGRMPPSYYLFFFTRPEISQQEIPQLWKKVTS